MTNTKKLWLGVVILALLSPLGLIIPALFGSGGGWGEWGLEEIEKLTGYSPGGMKKSAHIWKAPLTDYEIPGQSRGLMQESLGYVLTAIIGVVITAGLAYVLAKILSRKDQGN